MIAAALNGAIAIVINAENRRAEHEPHIGQSAQFRQSLGDEIHRRRRVDQRLFTQQTAAESEILFRENDPCAGAPRRQSRHQSSRTGADHQQVAKGVGLFIKVGIGRFSGAAEAGGAPDRRLIELFPCSPRPHESLVIESRAEKRREQTIDRQQVEGQRGEAILACRLQPVIKLDRGGAAVGLAPSAGAQGNQSIGFLGPGADNPARAMIFERAPHQLDIIGEQSRG